MDGSPVDELMGIQHGVISRAQVVAAGLGSSYVERKLRRREWSRVHRGVYVDHTGPLTWAQRAWAAVLCYWPAALGERSAVYPESSPSDDRIHVVVDHARRVRRTAGVKVHRVVHFAERVRWNASPPRLRLEEAVLDMCATAKTEFEALAVVTDVCQQRRTTARRLSEALARRARIRHGEWLRAVLADIATGAQSVLEHAYLNRVERAHRLPPGQTSEQVCERGASGLPRRGVRRLRPSRGARRPTVARPALSTGPRPGPGPRCRG